MSAPLVATLYGPRDVTLWVQDGRAWRLVGGQWLPVDETAGGLAGHVLTAAQLEALVARVGRPT